MFFKCWVTIICCHKTQTLLRDGGHWPPGTMCQCKKRIRYVQPPRPKSFRPNMVYNPEGNPPVSGDTIYKKSYKTFDPNDMSKCRTKPHSPKTWLVPAGDFHSDTTNKMSYGPWEGYKRQSKIPPKDHCLMGMGPMQEMTTTRHDYTPKRSNMDRTEKVVYPGCIGFSNQPMEQKTTNNLSYLWPDNFEQTNSFKPEMSYLPPTSKMENDTVQKLSYQPWESSAFRKQKFPWQEKNKYTTPAIPMNAETIYNNSYFAPGQFEEDASVEGCYCKYVGECFDKDGEPPKAHEFKECPIRNNGTGDGQDTGQTCNSSTSPLPNTIGDCKCQPPLV